MTPLRQHAVLRQIKDITLSATLSLGLLNGSVLLQSCGNSGNDARQREGQQRDSRRNEQTETFKKGVRTYITETAPGNFKITDEVAENDPAKAGAIVNYFDGHRDTLDVAAAKRLVQTDASTSQYFRDPSGYGSYHHNGLANVLLWGGLGYMLGRSTGAGFRNDERRYGAGAYANSGLYNRSSGIRESVRSSRVVTSRPSGGRGGFFGGRGGRSFSG